MQGKKHRNGEIYELTLPNSKLGAQELWTLPGMLPSTDGIVDRALVTCRHCTYPRTILSRIISPRLRELQGCELQAGVRGPRAVHYHVFDAITRSLSPVPVSEA